MHRSVAPLRRTMLIRVFFSLICTVRSKKLSFRNRYWWYRSKMFSVPTREAIPVGYYPKPVCYSKLLCYRNTRKISQIRHIQIQGTLSKWYRWLIHQKILNLRYPISQLKCWIRRRSYFRNSTSIQSCCLSGRAKRNTSDTCTQLPGKPKTWAHSQMRTLECTCYRIIGKQEVF